MDSKQKFEKVKEAGEKVLEAIKKVTEITEELDTIDHGDILYEIFNQSLVVIKMIDKYAFALKDTTPDFAKMYEKLQDAEKKYYEAVLKAKKNIAAKS